MAVPSRYRMSRRRPRHKAPAITGRCGTRSCSRNHLCVSTWKSCSARPARSCRSAGNDASSFRRAASEFVPEPEVGRRPDEERLHLGGVEAGQLRPVAPLEAVAARRPPHREDRNTRCRERLRVALHGALRDLELLGEVRDGQLSSRLQKEQERDKAARAHAADINA